MSTSWPCSRVGFSVKRCRREGLSPREQSLVDQRAGGRECSACRVHVSVEDEESEGCALCGGLGLVTGRPGPLLSKSNRPEKELFQSYSSLIPILFVGLVRCCPRAQAVGVLFTKMGRGQVEQETLAKVGQLVDSLQVSALACWCT